MARRRTLSQYLDTPPNGLAYVRVRVGDGKNPATVGWVAVQEHATAARKRIKDSDHALTVADDLRAAVLDMADGAGWPDELPTVRLHAHTTTGQELPGHQQTRRPADGTTATTGADVTATLADALVRMADRVSRQVDVLARALEHREAVVADALEAVIEQGQRQLDAEASALEASVAAALEAASTEPTGTSLPPAIEQVLGAAAAAMGMPTPESVDLASMSDEQIDAFLKDEELVNRVMARAAALHPGGGEDQGGDDE